MATGQNTVPDSLTTEQVIDLIFRDPNVKHGLSEFDDLKKKPHEILNIFSTKSETGRNKGEVRYFLKCLKQKTDVQVYSAKKAAPEEIVRQLWLYKLHHVYGYPWDHMTVEHTVTFGTITADKAADICVFQLDGKTPKIIVEVKRPDRKDGLAQLKSYLNAEGSPVGVWSNGRDRIILYRPYPREFEDTLTDIPAFKQQPTDVLRSKLTLADLRRRFDFKAIIQTLEELFLANSGDDEFNEIFKLIFAKLYDEKAARERKDNELTFRKSDDPEVTYATIDNLLRKAMDEWPGIFDDNEHIKLTPNHLQICIGPLERVRLLGANMRIMDDAFEYLMPSVAKKKNGQFFTPRYVIDMCVKMLNPARKEYVLDPACGSAGFLVHVLDYVWPADTDSKKEERKHSYAGKFLWGIDFDERSAKVSRALMLIAGDGRSHVFRCNSLDPREWFISREGEAFRVGLREHGLIMKKLAATKVIKEAEAWDFFGELAFDLILTNPPFAGEIRDTELLRRYDLAKPSLERKSKKGPKEERDVLFIERCLDMLKPGGRLAIVLPQGKFNNVGLHYIREWVLHRARLLGVVGLHGNTFKPHTGTKTSVLFLQKYTEEELQYSQSLLARISAKAPDYSEILKRIIETAPGNRDIYESDLPEEVQDILAEYFAADSLGNDEDIDPNAEPSAQPETESNEALAEQVQLRTKVVEGFEGKLAVFLENKRKLRPLKNDGDEEKQRKRLRLEEIESEQKSLVKRLAQESKELSDLEIQLAKLTVRGRLSLLLQNSEAIAMLRERWIDAELAKALNYPVFMAASRVGGKDSSGDYLYRVEPTNGEIVEDVNGDPLIAQDCVAYREQDAPQIAESFIAWAKTNKLTFWRQN